MPRNRRRIRPSAVTTTDHATIQQWVEEREGHPAHVIGTGSEDDPGLLRITFPGYSETRVEGITWEQFFRKFEEKRLAFCYQERTKTGEVSRYFKLISRDRPETEDEPNPRMDRSPNRRYSQDYPPRREFRSGPVNWTPPQYNG